MTYLYSFVVGGLMVMAVTYLTKNGLPAASGIIMTLPVITLASLLILPNEASFKVAAFGIVGVLALFVFLATYIASMIILGSGSKYTSLVIAFVTWCVVILTAVKLFPDILRR